MLKRPSVHLVAIRQVQPPSGGCVLKLRLEHMFYDQYIQPPSGGCVLKQKEFLSELKLLKPAAFGRLCVETVTDLENVN